MSSTFIILMGTLVTSTVTDARRYLVIEQRQLQQRQMEYQQQQQRERMLKRQRQPICAPQRAPERAPTATIATCSQYGQNRISSNETIPEDFRIQTEADIAVQEHFSGLKPVSYALTMKFHDLTNNVSMNLEANVIKPTKHLMLNIDPTSLLCDFQTVTIDVVTADANVTDVCIENFTIVEELQVLVIHLTKALPQYASCTISFPECVSTVYDAKSDIGAKGLRLSRYNQSESIYSSFYRRYARTVFPCMDHPTLKATFRLCLLHDPTFSVASSMPEMSEFCYNRSSSQKTQTCFQETPPIATFSLSFAVMKAYKKIITEDSYYSLFLPVEKTDDLQWILRTAVNFQRLLETSVRTSSQFNEREMSKFPIPFPNVQLLFVYPEMSLEASSLGLITLNGSAMEREPNATGNMGMLYRAIVQQWLGNTVTVKNWNEICLQEGLVEYLEWLFIAESMPPDWITRHAHDAVVNAAYRSSTLLEEPVCDNKAVSCECPVQAPLIFHGISQRIRKNYATEFLRKLLEKYSFTNAGINDWDVTVYELYDSMIDLDNTYLSDWFRSPSPLQVIVSWDESQDLTVQNKHVDGESPRSTYFSLYCSTDKTPKHKSVIKTRKATFWFPTTPRWCLVDPDGVTLTYKIYDVLTYKNVLEDSVNNSGPLTEKRLQRFVEDFCTSLLNDFLTYEEPRENATWLDVFELAKTKVQHDPVCSCCVTAPADRESWCSNGAPQCDRLSLVKNVFPNSDNQSTPPPVGFLSTQSNVLQD